MPQVVRELQRSTALRSGDWRRGLGVFTYAVSVACGVALVLYGFPEKDFKGRDHVFSGIIRQYNRKRDEFFGVPQSKAPPAGTSS